MKSGKRVPALHFPSHIITIVAILTVTMPRPLVAEPSSPQTKGQNKPTTELQQAEQRVEQLAQTNHKLRKLARSFLVGKPLGDFTDKQGTIYQDATVLKIGTTSITLGHLAGKGRTRTSTTLKLDDCPAEWALLGDSSDQPQFASQPPVKSGATGDLSAAIVVIEGDKGTGTGFLANDNGKTYLFTAAHVLSGNQKLAVKLPTGRKITRFGAFQACEGADLVRLEVLEPVEHTLNIADSAGLSDHGVPIIAAGNSGGGGTIGFEGGKIMGVGPESIEIDAQVIQGNSGGPIVIRDSLAVIGVVTHLVDARKDKWAETTRYSDIRRFGARLDRDWEWREMPIGRFLGEGSKLKEIQDYNMMIAIALVPSSEPGDVLDEYKTTRISKEIRSLRSWLTTMRSSNRRISDTDWNRRINSFLTSLKTMSVKQIKDVDANQYAWFHKEMGSQLLIQRHKLISECEKAIEVFRPGGSSSR
ncbi:MAG: trypsin-like peptidase domain-containing protein [Verrucomicrobiota bacterium JB025]|nr:trypsin-like peptidase domain-containing protein [Verrucomicrobiota bacterium JB025]